MIGTRAREGDGGDLSARRPGREACGRTIRRDRQVSRSSPYSARFYSEFHRYTLESAKVIVPLVVDLLHPGSVVDVGCGRGVFLSVFRENGAGEVVGLDGDWVDRTQLLIPETDFIVADLNCPLPVTGTFDLAVSLEVAEHLPEANASRFVRTLTELAPAVLFSAAIPFQGGTNHFNEQWPEYWVKLFEERDYAVIDCIRKGVWNDDRVAFWYAQNILLFVEASLAESDERLKDELEATCPTMLSVVHPNKYLPTARAVARLRDRMPGWAQRMAFKMLSRGEIDPGG